MYKFGSNQGNTCIKHNNERCDGQYSEEAFGSGPSRREGRTRFGLFFERQKSQHLSNVKLLQPRADLFKLGCHVLCGGERQQVPGKESIQANADTDVGQLSNVSIDVVLRAPGQKSLQIYVSKKLLL